MKTIDVRKLIINIITDSLITDRMIENISDIVHGIISKKYENTWEPYEFYTGIKNAIQLMGVKNENLEAKLMETYLQDKFKRSENPVETAKEIYSEWLIIIRGYGTH